TQTRRLVVLGRPRHSSKAVEGASQGHRRFLESPRTQRRYRVGLERAWDDLCRTGAMEGSSGRLCEGRRAAKGCSALYVPPGAGPPTTGGRAGLSQALRRDARTDSSGERGFRSLGGMDLRTGCRRRRGLESSTTARGQGRGRQSKKLSGAESL